jgi:hypothetical protein
MIPDLVEHRLDIVPLQLAVPMLLQGVELAAAMPSALTPVPPAAKNAHHVSGEGFGDLGWQLDWFPWHGPDIRLEADNYESMAGLAC